MLAVRWTVVGKQYLSLSWTAIWRCTALKRVRMRSLNLVSKRQMGKGRLEQLLPVQLATSGSIANDCKVFTPVTGYRATTEVKGVAWFDHCKPSIVCPAKGWPEVNGGTVGPEIPDVLTSCTWWFGSRMSVSVLPVMYW